MTLVTTPKYEVLFSYETPVAALEIASGKLFKTDKKWSVTTSRQINKWLGGEEAEARPQEFFDGLNEAVKKAKIEESVINSIIESINWISNRQMSVIKESTVDYGTVEYGGETYTLLDNAEPTNRLLPGNYDNISDVSDGEEYQFEMSCPARNENGDECIVYWIFTDIKGEGGNEDYSNFDYDDVDRVKCDGVNESVEDDGDKLWWTSSSGNIEIQMSLDQAESVSVGGQDASGAVAEVLEDPFIQDQLAKISDEELIKALSEYGAWDDEELQDRARNEERLIWIAGGDISEEQFMKGSDEEELQEDTQNYNDKFYVFDDGGEDSESGSTDRYTIILADDYDREVDTENVDEQTPIPCLISGNDPRGTSGHDSIVLKDLIKVLNAPEMEYKKDTYLGDRIEFSQLPEAVQKFAISEYDYALSEEKEQVNESGSLDQALQYMNQLIAKGVEYPDAHTQAIMKFDVDGDDLADLYDNQDLQEIVNVFNTR